MHAVSRVVPVAYAEIVASISSASAGPGTRANIDEFTNTTSKAIEVIGGATVGKAIIILNPAEPPLLMRDTVYCQIPLDADTDKIEQSIRDVVAEVAGYVARLSNGGRSPIRCAVSFRRRRPPTRAAGWRCSWRSKALETSSLLMREISTS